MPSLRRRLIAAIDCVDMFRVWRVLTGPSSNTARANAAMTNLINHYAGKETAFVEHVLFLCVLECVCLYLFVPVCVCLCLSVSVCVCLCV